MCAHIYEYGDDVSFIFNRKMIESWRFFEVQLENFILCIPDTKNESSLLRLLFSSIP